MLVFGIVMLGVAVSGMGHGGVVGVGTRLGVSDLGKVLPAGAAECCGSHARMLLPKALLLTFSL